MSYRPALATLLLTAGLYGLAGCASNPANNVPKAGVNTPGPSGSPAVVASAAPGASTTPGASATPAATPQAPGTPHAAGDQVLPLAEGTEVKFTGSKVTGSENGGFRRVTGEVTVPKDDDLTKAKIDVKIDMSSIYTDDERLTTHLIGPEFFDTNKYPITTFKSTAITKTDGGYLVTGELYMHGVTQSINIPADINLNTGALTAKSEFSINRKLFKIEYPGKPDDLIRDDVVITFDIKAGATRG